MSDFEVLEGRGRPRVVVEGSDSLEIREARCVVKARVEDEGRRFEDVDVGFGRGLPYKLLELEVILRER